MAVAILLTLGVTANAENTTQSNYDSHSKAMAAFQNIETQSVSEGDMSAVTGEGWVRFVAKQAIAKSLVNRYMCGSWFGVCRAY